MAMKLVDQLDLENFLLCSVVFCVLPLPFIIFAVLVIGHWGIQKVVLFGIPPF